jgi:hypothetical protein
MYYFLGSEKNGQRYSSLIGEEIEPNYIRSKKILALHNAIEGTSILVNLAQAVLSTCPQKTLVF